MMLEKLQRHWKVDLKAVLLILATFAITGSVTAWVSKAITTWIEVQRFSAEWWLLKVFVLIIGYQAFILFFGFCLGKFAFFWNYEKKILRKLGLMKRVPLQKKTIRLAIFASGSGTNADAIIRYFNRPVPDNALNIVVALIVCNKPGAGVINIAKNNNIEVLNIERTSFLKISHLIEDLRVRNIDYIILAGFLWKIPGELIQAWPNRIINIHPALLPKYGGSGMYGKHVHEAVINNKEQESGISIHFVDEQYDHGETIFQATCDIVPGETADSLANKIHLLEHRHFGPTIESVIKKQN